VTNIIPFSVPALVLPLHISIHPCFNKGFRLEDMDALLDEGTLPSVVHDGVFDDE
jgi:hypothetical protein